MEILLMRILLLSIALLVAVEVISNCAAISSNIASFHNWVVEGGTTELIVWAAVSFGLLSLITLVISLL
jgi:hypothetical protein